MTTVIWSHPTLTPKKRTVLVSKKGGKLIIGVAVPERAHPDHDEQQADGRHHLEGGRRRFEDAGEQLEAEALDGREHEQDQQGGPGPGHPVLGVQVVEDEHG